MLVRLLLKFMIQTALQLAKKKLKTVSLIYLKISKA
jgi:hypothetical protein